MPTYYYTVDRLVTRHEQIRVEVQADDEDAAYDEVLRRSDAGELSAWQQLHEEVQEDEPELVDLHATRTLITCSLCGRHAQAATAHLHQGEWIGDLCCWDERLKASE